MRAFLVSFIYNGNMYDDCYNYREIIWAITKKQAKNIALKRYCDENTTIESIELLTIQETINVIKFDINCLYSRLKNKWFKQDLDL